MGIEYELKYAATLDTQKKLRSHLGGVWQEYRMHTTYYDTPGGSLSARKWTLRHRLENDTHVCTVKTPAGDARGEWETCEERIEAAVEKLCKLGAPEALRTLTREGLVEVCGARFTRLAATVIMPEGTVEVALDAGVLYAGQREEPLCEVEVELKDGSAAAADRLAEELSARFGLSLLKKSKFKRALALRETT